MIISSNTAEYEVLEILEQGYCRTVYRCIKPEQDKRQEYTLIRVTKRDWFSHMLEQVWETRERGGYPDLAEFFTLEEGLFLAFFREAGISLKEYLEQNVPGLNERLELAGELLRQMAFRQNSFCFLEDVLCPEQIGVMSGKKIHFWYHLHNIQEERTVGMGEICKGVDRVWSVLFARNLDTGSPPGLSAFSQWLKAGQAETVPDLYREYWQMRTDGFGEEKRRRDLIRDQLRDQLGKRKKWIRLLLYMLLWLCIAAAFACLGYLWKDIFRLHSGEGCGVKFIGDVGFP